MSLLCFLVEIYGFLNESQADLWVFIVQFKTVPSSNSYSCENVIYSIPDPERNKSRKTFIDCNLNNGKQ